MACGNLSNTNADSEMEEGEIVDELDELSDISSEEEFLLRQRLQVLENYNNVLERKEAKRTSIGPGKNHRRVEALYDHSQISGTDADDGFSKLKYRITKEHKPIKLHKQRRIKQIESIRYKDTKKKVQRKKKLDVKNNSDTSDYSDDEYRNKRKKLADAVSFNKVKNDTSTLKDRINKMLCVSKSEHHIIKIENKNDKDITLNNNKIIHEVLKEEEEIIKLSEVSSVNEVKSCQIIDLYTDDSNTVSNSGVDTVDSVTLEKNVEGNSDEDLELLRQHALKTKSKTIEKVVITKEGSETKPNLSDEEDSDTAELRLICLKSALLKKAIAMKRKQKLQKKRFQVVQNNLDINTSDCEVNIDNNTDVESVDMDIGSDAEDKGKSLITECDHESGNQNILEDNSYRKKSYKEDEIEEDEDLLRAKLLTSLSKTLPNLLNLNVFNSKSDESTESNIESVKDLKNVKTENDKNIKINEPPPVVAEEKKFIIHLGESDSEGEHEATKNLTKMHIKLSEQAEFQQKLDNLLKTVRNKTEETKLPDLVQKPVKLPQKIVAKAMNHLPKSEQIEYRNLVKRMAELEKIKQARRISSSGINQMTKETLKPRNVSIDSKKPVVTKNIDEKIALSRKKIAEESSKIINLKEESKKLAQRYKIVATELRNITTAITINKKQQKSVQDGLTKIRLQHQMLLQGTNRHSNHIPTRTNNKVLASKLQKENNPTKEDHKVPNNLKSLKVSVVNDLSKEITLPRLSVQLDTNSNKKNIKIPKSPIMERVVDFKKVRSHEDSAKTEDVDFETDKESRLKCAEIDNKMGDVNEYVSPLDVLECKKTITDAIISECFVDGRRDLERGSQCGPVPFRGWRQLQGSRLQISPPRSSHTKMTTHIRLLHASNIQT